MRHSVSRRDSCRCDVSAIPSGFSFLLDVLTNNRGLGKTLSMLSLIASSVESSKQSGSTTQTLVIVPLSLIHTWDSQLRSHTHPSALSWKVYHDHQHCDGGMAPLFDQDIIITTYDRVVARMKRPHQDALGLFSRTWTRLVLDEGRSPSQKLGTNADFSQSTRFETQTP